MRVPYGLNKEYFKYSLFLVFCNRVTTSAVSAVFLLVCSYYWKVAGIVCIAVCFYLFAMALMGGGIRIVSWIKEFWLNC